MTSGAKKMGNELTATSLVEARLSAGYEPALDAVTAFGWKVVNYHAHEYGYRLITRADALAYTPALLLQILEPSHLSLRFPCAIRTTRRAELGLPQHRIPKIGIFPIPLRNIESAGSRRPKPQSMV